MLSEKDTELSLIRSQHQLTDCIVCKSAFIRRMKTNDNIMFRDNDRVLRLLIDKLTTIQNRISALERSIEEIKLDWTL